MPVGAPALQLTYLAPFNVYGRAHTDRAGLRAAVAAELRLRLIETTVASTTVSSIEQITEPCAWRAISPVSSVTWWAPYEKVFLIEFTGILESKKRSSSAHGSMRRLA